MSASKSSSVSRDDKPKQDRIADKTQRTVNDSASSVIAKGNRALTFVLFSEILEDSPAQSRANVFDPNRSPKDRELLESIKTNGIIQPIVIRPLENSGLDFGVKKGERKFAIVAGHRRVAAGKAAGQNGVQGIIARSDDNHELITLAENMGRRELSSYERAQALKSLQERRGLSVRKVADLVGVSPAYTSELFSALSAPGFLLDSWKDGSVSTKAVVDLKDHWSSFEKVGDDVLLSQLRSLTQAGARSLRDQLDAGTDLADALTSMGSLSAGGEQESGAGSQRGPYKKSPRHKVIENNKAYKESFIAAVQDVFSKLNQEKAKALFDNAIAHSIDDADTLWAAALYVAKGGNQKEAAKLAAAAMKIPRARSLINYEIRVMKKAAANLDKIKSKDKSVAPFVKKIFPGI